CRFVHDHANRVAALQSGEVNVIDSPEPQAIVAAESSPQMNHIDAPRPGSVNRIELNSAQAPFDDKRVREAFILAADVEPGIESLRSEEHTSELQSRFDIVCRLLLEK